MFKSSWLQKLHQVFNPLVMPFRARKRTARVLARQSVQSLEHRDLLTVTLSLSALSVSEADDATTREITLTAENDADVASDSTVEISLAGLSPSDYSLSDLTILIPAGQRLGTVTLTINDDNLVELEENAVVSLINPTGGLAIDPVNGQQSLTVTDNDQALLSIDGVAIAEGNSGTGQLIFTVTLDGAVDFAVSVDFATADDTATAGTDYTATSGTLNFTANDAVPQTRQITVDVSGDQLVELDETLFANLLNLNAGGRNVVIAENQGLGTIQNDDQALLSIDGVAIAEGNSGTGQLIFTVTLDAAVDFAVSVDFATADDTATAGTDYTATSGTLNFTANDAVPQTRQITVDVSGDQLVELDETLFANFLNLNAGGRNVVIAENQGIGTIQNDDQALLSIDDVAIAEGNSGTGQLIFTVTLDAAVDFAVSVDFATADDTATAGTDYTATSGTLNFTANDAVPQTRQITVDVSGDQLVELDETLFANLLNLNAGGRNVVIAENQGIGTIQNDDQALLSIDDVAIAEGNSGTGQLIFTVTLDAAVDFAVSVDFATADDTATAGTDYTATSGTLNFTANGALPQTRQIAVNVTGEQLVELDETLFVNLLNLTAGGRNVVITDNQGLGTILADDSANLSVAISSVRQFEGAGVLVAVTADLAVQGGFDVLVSMSGIGATIIQQAELVGQTNPDFSITLNQAVPVPGSPNTVRLRFNSGVIGTNSAPNQTRTFRLEFIQDTIVEGEEVVRAALGTLTATEAGLESRINTSTADDFRDVRIMVIEGANPIDTASVTITPVGAASKAENSGPAIFRATLNGIVEGGFQAAGFTVVDALSNLVQRTEGAADFGFTSVPLAFLPTNAHFVTSGTFVDLTVTIVDDNVVELDEQYQVIPGAITGTTGPSFDPSVGPARITTQGATGTIENDDLVITITRIVADNPLITSVSDYNNIPNAQPLTEPANSYSLREAILLSNAARGNQRIVFADSLADVGSLTFAGQFAAGVEVSTVTLKGSLPTITAPLELTGPHNSRPADMLKIVAEKIPGTTPYVRESFALLDVAVASPDPGHQTVISGFNFAEANGPGVSAVTVRNSRNVTIHTSMFTFNRSKAAPGNTARGAALLIIDSTGIQVTGSTFWSNAVLKATGTAAFGGAVAVLGSEATDVSIENSTFFRNDADTSGGVLHINNPLAAVTLNHITAADNVAYTAAGAAAIHRENAASLTVRNSIVAINNNVRQVSRRSVLAEQLLVGNASVTNSLIWFPPQSLKNLPLDAPQKDPVLATLQDAGGRTLVMPPSNFLAGFGYRTYQQGTSSIIMSSSPAINQVPAGTSGTTVDQRGVPRSFGNADIGAVEVQAIQSRALQVNRLTASAGEILIGWGTLDGADIIQADRGAPPPGDTTAVDIMLTPLDTVANVTGEVWKSLLVDSQRVQLVGNPPTGSGQKLRVRHFLTSPITRPRNDLQMTLQGLPAGNYRVEILGLNADRVVSGMSYAVGVSGTFTSIPAVPSGSRLLDDLFSDPGSNLP